MSPDETTTQRVPAGPAGAAPLGRAPAEVTGESAQPPRASDLLLDGLATRYTDGPAAALAEVDGLIAQLDGYRLLHATRALLLSALGRPDEAREAARRAHALATNPAERELLARRIATY